MKFCLLLIVLLVSSVALAESNCDVRVGDSVGLRVVEFATGNVVHSKMSLNEMTADTLLEEMINLQDMGICKEKIFSQKCVLRYEKGSSSRNIALFRGMEKWLSWAVGAKTDAQKFIKNLKRVGFCS